MIIPNHIGGRGHSCKTEGQRTFCLNVTFSMRPSLNILYKIFLIYFKSPEQVVITTRYSLPRPLPYSSFKLSNIYQTIYLNIYLTYSFSALYEGRDTVYLLLYFLNKQINTRVRFGFRKLNSSSLNPSVAAHTHSILSPGLSPSRSKNLFGDSGPVSSRTSTPPLPFLPSPSLHAHLGHPNPCLVVITYISILAWNAPLFSFQTSKSW